MTPSGLSIGITLKTKLSRSLLATGSSLTRKSITPFIMNDAFDSPGWILALITTPSFFLSYSIGTLFVIVRYSHLFPAIVLQRVLRDT